MTVEMSVSGDQCIVLQWMGMLAAVPLASYVAPRGDFRKRSAHGPLFPDHVRTMVFSVHLFRTFSEQKADQRWTVQRGRTVAKRVARLPNRGVTANQARNGRIRGPTKKVRTWSAFSGPCPDFCFFGPPFSDFFYETGGPKVDILAAKISPPDLELRNPN